MSFTLWTLLELWGVSEELRAIQLSLQFSFENFSFFGWLCLCVCVFFWKSVSFVYVYESVVAWPHFFGIMMVVRTAPAEFEKSCGQTQPSGAVFSGGGCSGSRRLVGHDSVKCVATWMEESSNLWIARLRLASWWRKESSSKTPLPPSPLSLTQLQKWSFPMHPRSLGNNSFVKELSKYGY